MSIMNPSSTTFSRSLSEITRHLVKQHGSMCRPEGTCRARTRIQRQARTAPRDCRLPAFSGHESGHDIITMSKGEPNCTCHLGLTWRPHRWCSLPWAWWRSPSRLCRVVGPASNDIKPQQSGTQIITIRDYNSDTCKKEVARYEVIKLVVSPEGIGLEQRAMHQRATLGMAAWCYEGRTIPYASSRSTRPDFTISDARSSFQLSWAPCSASWGPSVGSVSSNEYIQTLRDNDKTRHRHNPMQNVMAQAPLRSIRGVMQLRWCLVWGTNP